MPSVSAPVCGVLFWQLGLTNTWHLSRGKGGRKRGTPWREQGPFPRLSLKVCVFIYLFILLFKKKFFFNVSLFLRQRKSMNGGGAERERETQNRKQAPGSEPSAQNPTRGSNSRSARSWPEPKSDASPTEPSGRP